MQTVKNPTETVRDPHEVSELTKAETVARSVRLKCRSTLKFRKLYFKIKLAI